MTADTSPPSLNAIAAAPPDGPVEAPPSGHLFGPPGQDRWRRWLTYLLPWMIPTMIVATQRQMLYRNWNLPVSFFEEFSFQFYHWYLYAFLALYVFQLLRRFPIRRNQLLRSIVPHLLGMVVFIGARSLIMALVIHHILGGYYEVPRLFTVVLGVYTLKHLTFDGMMYWLIVGAGQLKETFRHQRQQELWASQLQTRLATAQLSALKMQLHPHFLFNTLNAIAALVRTGDNKGAVRMIVGLSELLRLALDSQKAQEVPLEQELGFLDRYLAIEQVRFPDRLRVTRDIDESLMDALVPNLILQPLVENAICHGLAPRSEPGHILIRAAREGDELLLEVCDDGPGMPEGWSLEASHGVGLSNTRARLAQLYGPRQRFEVATQEGGGVCGRIRMPLRVEGAQAEDAA